MDTDSLYQFEDLGLSNNIQWDKNSSFETCLPEITHTDSNSNIQQQAKTYLYSTEAKKTVLIGIHHAFNQQPHLNPQANKCCQFWITPPIDSKS